MLYMHNMYVDHILALIAVVIGLELMKKRCYKMKYFVHFTGVMQCLFSLSVCIDKHHMCWNWTLITIIIIMFRLQDITTNQSQTS